MKKRIVITGLGPIGSVGIGKDLFWEGVRNEKTGIKLIKSFMDNEFLDEYFIHKVDGFDIDNFGIDKESLNYIRDWKEGEENVDLNYLLAAIKLALDDSSLNYIEPDNNLGVVVSHENPGLEQLLWKLFKNSYELTRKKLLNRKDYFDELLNRTMKNGYEAQSFMTLFHIARTFNIHKYSLFLNNACASGLYSLEMASDMIQCDKAEAVVVASADCPDIFKHRWFKLVNMYAEDGKTKPFSNNCNGFVMGEGATALILEDYDHAINRKAHIYAEYLGSGFSLEGWGITTPMIGGQYYQETIKEALDKANIKNSEIDLICAHGVATRANDYYEAKAINDIFENCPDVPVTALKPFVGHNLGGCALLELAILLMSMENKVIPPTLNVKNLDPRIKLNLVRKKTKVKIKTILKLSCAFAGYNAATILKKV